MKLNDEQKAALALTKKGATESYMQINFGYDAKIVLPYKDGVAIMAAMEKAEHLNDSYGDRGGIGPISNGKIILTTIGRDTYEKLKMQYILKVSKADIDYMMD